MNEHLSKASEVFDDWRVVPRVLVGSYCLWAAHLIWVLSQWYMHMATADRTAQDAGFVAAVISAVTGFGVPIFRIYSQNGRNLRDRPWRHY